MGPDVAELIDRISPSDSASLAIAWVDDGTPGQRIVSRGGAATATTVFEIGSITKGLTGICLARLVLAGSVALSTRLVDLLPYEDRLAFEHLRPVTLEGLATHRSGLPRLANLGIGYAWKNRKHPYANIDGQRLAAALATTKLQKRSPVLYSNLGFGLLGWTLARHQSTDYAGLTNDLVLEPLAMARTTCLSPGHGPHDMAAPFDPNGKPGNHWTFSEPTAGAGAIGSTLADMAKLLAVLLEPGEGPTGSAIALATAPRVAQDERSSIGFGWMTTAVSDGTKVIWHNGATGSFSSFIGVNRERGTGIVVLLNQPRSDQIDTACVNYLGG